MALAMRGRARTSAVFSSREIVGRKAKRRPEGAIPWADSNTGSRRSLGAALPSSHPAAIIDMREHVTWARDRVTSAGSRGWSGHPARRSATPSRPSTSRGTSTPAPGGGLPPTKQAFTGRPATGDRPGSDTAGTSTVHDSLPRPRSPTQDE